MHQTDCPGSTPTANSDHPPDLVVQTQPSTGQMRWGPIHWCCCHRRFMTINNQWQPSVWQWALSHAVGLGYNKPLHHQHDPGTSIKPGLNKCIKKLPTGNKLTATAIILSRTCWFNHNHELSDAFAEQIQWCCCHGGSGTIVSGNPVGWQLAMVKCSTSLYNHHLTHHLTRHDVLPCNKCIKHDCQQAVSLNAAAIITMLLLMFNGNQPSNGSMRFNLVGAVSDRNIDDQAAS